MRNCSICEAHITEENPEILSMGGYGNPRYLCTECAETIERMTAGVEYDEIRLATSRIGEKMTAANVDDPVVIRTVGELMAAAKERAEAIREGTYDFSLDEVEEPQFEITEDLQETEEDRELDRQDREAEAKLDRAMNWAWVGVGIAFIAFLVWRFFF